jgi:AbiEi antitoxin C-terminal domain/Protein of unknown function (DUF559)
MDDRPFRGRDATRNDLRRHHRRVFHGVYIAETTDLTAAVKARAAWLATGPRVTLAGLSAAAIHGAKWLDGRQPAEVIRADRHSPPGIVVRSDDIADDEVWLVAGMRVTSPARTAFDIGRRRPVDTAIPILDDLLNATGITPVDIAAIADRRPGARGIRRLRSLLPLVDGGAESPQESRLRLLVVRGGLPPPDTQIRFPELGIRVDMGWPQWKVALEYDGIQHWADARQRTWDIERIVRLESAGWVVIRVSAEMLSRPAVIVDRVRNALRAAGCAI